MKVLICLGVFVVLGLSACGQSPEQHDLVLDTAEESAGIVGAEAYSTSDLGFKAAVALVNNDSGEDYCSGTLIGPRLVLTAAHCTNTGKIFNRSVRFFDGSTAQSVAGLRHASYGINDSDYDVAVIWLNRAAPPAAKIASLPQAPLKVGTHKTRAFGVGKSTSKGTDLGKMRMVNLQGAVLAERPQFIRYQQKNGKGVCNGDSGGPHFMYSKGQPVLVALTTEVENSRRFFGPPSDLCRGNTIATLTGNYVNWIANAKKAVSEYAQEISKSKQ